MKAEKIKDVLEQHLKMLGGVSAVIPDGYRDILFEEIPHVNGLHHGHAVWMCQQAIGFVNEGQLEKALIWLGWVNHQVWRGNYLTLREIDDICKDD